MMDTDFERNNDPLTVLYQDSIQHVWNRFKKIHPNTGEMPEFTKENLHRWIYHIRQYEGKQFYETVKLDTLDIERIREIRKIDSFDSFDRWGKKYYLEIAKCFPGEQVYACGSQVRGDWFTFCMPNASTVIDARKKAGMRVDRYSDYDFWIHQNAVESKPIPDYADRYRGKFNEKEMVAIPIYYGDI